MSLIESIILGLVQGLSEFLPISSSGHLAVLQNIFGISGDNVMMFTVMLHFGTLISIFIAYRKDIAALIIELFATIKDIFTGKGIQVNKNETRRLGVLIIIATIPTGIIGLLFNDFFESLYTSMLMIGICLIITGTCLFMAERFGGGTKGIRETGFLNAFIVGVCQTVAMMPGISRSGATIVGGLSSGFKREHAVKFAFLISIPAVLGAFLMELPEAAEAITSGGAGMSMGVMLAGIAVAAVSGYAAIKMMISAVVNNKLIYFSYYTWLAGGALIIYSLIS